CEVGGENGGTEAGGKVRKKGIEIPSRARPQIMEVFYREKKARPRHSGGAGLGLSIVKSICSAQGGELSIFSSEGEGTRVRIEMPRTNGKAQVAEEGSAKEYLHLER